MTRCTVRPGRRPRRARRPRLASAPAAALAAIGFLLAHFGGHAHLAAVRHEVCDLHGVVEHAASPAAGTATDAAPAGGPAAAARTDAPDGSPHHESCLLSFLTRESALSRPSGDALPAFAPLPARAVVRHAVTPASAIPVYRIAPKHSPPAPG